jgi:hypothetical protein
MIAEYQIRERLARYLRGENSLDQFEDWLVQRSWNMHRDSGDAAKELVSAIELRLAEYSSGHLDEQSLRSELLPFINTYASQFSIGGGLPAIAGSPNNISGRRVIQIAFQAQRVLRQGEDEHVGIGLSGAPA